MPSDLDRLLDLLASTPRGELSTVLHFAHHIPEAVLETALSRGYVTGVVEPIKNVRHPPVRLRITASGMALREFARA
jgi:hypothetical protein